jgi:hypothetical protein
MRHVSNVRCIAAALNQIAILKSATDALCVKARRRRGTAE